MRIESIYAGLVASTPTDSVGSPSPDSLSQFDKSMCLSALTNKEAALVLAKVQNCYISRYELSEYVWRSMERHFKTKARQPGILAYLLDDIIKNKKCKTCNGVGELMINAKQVICPNCKGSPNIHTSMARLGRELAIKKQSWHEIYHKDYLHVIQIYDALEQQACGKLRKRFYN